MQQLKSLRPHFYIQRSDPRDVGLRSVQASDKFSRNRVKADLENNRDCCGCCLRCKGSNNATGHSNDVNPTTDKIGCQRRQAIMLTTCPAIFDDYTSAFVVAYRAQALAECVYSNSKSLRRFASQISDDRHCWLLLRAHRKRLSGYGTAESPKKISPPHVRSQDADIVPIGGALEHIHAGQFPAIDIGLQCPPSGSLTRAAPTWPRSCAGARKASSAHVHARYPLAQAAQALNDIASRKVMGKAVLTL